MGERVVLRRCPKCRGELHFQVNVFVSAPSSYVAGLSKAALRSTDIRILGADWPRASWYCPKGDWAEPAEGRPLGPGWPPGERSNG